MELEISNISKNRKRMWRSTRHKNSTKYLRGFSLIEKMFWYYKDIKQVVNEIREEQRERSLPGGGFEFVPHGNSNNSYIEKSVEQLNTPISHIKINVNGSHEIMDVRKPELWIAMVEETLKILEKDDPSAADVMYRRYLKNESMNLTCIDLAIKYNKDFGYNVYYRKRDYGIHRAREVAIQLGLIKVF